MCTNITLKSENKIVTGRTNEFALILKSNFVTFSRGELFNSFASDSTKGFTWKGLYGFVGVTAPEYSGENFALDGLNEKGLSVQGLYFPKFVGYAPCTDESKSLTCFSFTNYVLSNFKNVSEVKNGLSKLDVVAEPCKLNGNVEPFHFQVNDADGHAIVVEFVDGETKIYDNDFGVMTNSPDFPIHLINLGNYTNLDNFNHSQVQYGDHTIFQLGQGSGALGLPGDMTPQSRFVRASFLTKYAQCNDKDIVGKAFHILNSFDIVDGTTCDKCQPELVKKLGSLVIPVGEDGITEVTQFTIVKDLTEKSIYFKDMFNQNIRKISLNSLDFSANAPKIKLPILTGKCEYEDVTSKMN